MGGAADYIYDDSAPAGQWGMQYGSRAPRITLFERDNRGGDTQPPLYARWWVNKKRRGPRRVHRVPTIRDESGRIDMDLRQDAEKEAKRIWEAVQAGTDPDVIFAEPEDEEDGEHTEPEDLTLGEGLELFLDPDDGRYSGETDSEWFDDQVRRGKRLKDALGRDTLWMHLTPAKIKSLWVKLHNHYSDTAHTGRRESIRTVQLLGSARSWLVTNGRLSQAAPELPANWRRKIKQYWQKKADEEITVSRPAHSEQELRLVAAAARDPSYDIDPRFRALLRMGLGQRLGPVGMRALRSNLELDDSGRWELGHLTIASRPGKQGVRIDLNAELREMWETILKSGYLHDLEVAYQDGQIDDYHLLPGGRMRQGVAPVGNGDEPVLDRWMNTQLKRLEREIYQRHEDLDMWTSEQHESGTMHIKGRGWHGLRRGMVELLDEMEVSPSVRNAMLGWVPGSRTPELVYQSRDSDQRYDRAAEQRAEVDDFLGGGLPDTKTDGRSRADVRADLDDAMEDGDMDRVRQLMAELDELEGGGT